MTVAEVRLWGRRIGAVAVEGPGEVASFEYDEAFRASGIEVAPIVMPLANRVYRFPELAAATFHGLPGMLADALPDKFGNAVIDAWLATQGRLAGEIDAVERLCYTGSRGMGALEFLPALGPRAGTSRPVEVSALVELASRVLEGRERFATSFEQGKERDGLLDILRVGSSAGGARAKAVIAWNPTTNEVRSGDVPAPAGFEPWLLKFDGVDENQDRDIGVTLGYGAIEYAYSAMARAAGVRMEETRLFEENGRRHFMVRRFDRAPDGSKRHMQSLAALAHLDFNQPGAHSYEQAFVVLRRLDAPMEDVEEQFRRTVFNVVSRNQDDHVKNIAFLMDKEGRWRLSPAFDVVYAHNPSGLWTAQHQMSLAGKRDGFEVADFVEVARTASLKRGRAEAILGEVRAAVLRWPEFAAAAGVARDSAEQIAAEQRLDLGG